MPELTQKQQAIYDYIRRYIGERGMAPSYEEIRKTLRYGEAPVKGTSVLAYDPTGEAAQAYRRLAREVLNGSQARQHA